MAWRHCCLPLALGAAALCATAPAGADWLVLRDGSRVETRGAWEERGATMVFHLPNGTLGSVRTRDVDRDATAAANAPAPPQPTAAPSAPRPVAVLTDADVGHVNPAPLAAEQAAAAPAKAAAAPAAGAAGAAKPPSRLEVTDWRRDAASTTLVLVGEVRNTSPAVTTGVRLTALVYDEKGELLATSDAILGADVLQPGQSTNFRASFPGVGSYATVKFETKHYAMKVAEPPEPSAP